MSERMTQVAPQLSDWVVTAEPNLAAMEQPVFHTLKELANTLLAALLALRTPRYPRPPVPCSCGQSATYQRERPAQVDSLLGCVHMTRAYYLCAPCQRGQAPLDQPLGFCAGLNELRALRGALCPFDEAVPLIPKLSLGAVSAHSSKTASEELGAASAQAEPQALDTAPDRASRALVCLDGWGAGAHP
jgi:hypothetical protein